MVPFLIVLNGNTAKTTRGTKKIAVVMYNPSGACKLISENSKGDKRPTHMGLRLLDFNTPFQSALSMLVQDMSLGPQALESDWLSQ